MSMAIVQPVFDAHPSYKGGGTMYDGQYIWEFCPTHWLSNRWGWVLQAWMVAEDKLGRPLYRDPNDPHMSECVHHVDEVKTNNHPDNLEVMTRRAHWQHHLQTTGEKNGLPLTDEQVATALVETKNVDRAAKLLHCSGQTLRNRFPLLVQPYLRRKPSDHTDPKLIARMHQWANDPNMRACDIDWDPPLTEYIARGLCERMGIQPKRRAKRDGPHATYRGRPTSKDPRTIAFVRKRLGIGDTIDMVADKLQVKRETVATICRANGIPYVKKKPSRPPVPRGSHVPFRDGKMTCSNPHLVDYVRKQLSRRTTVEQVALQVGHTVTFVRELCRRHGIPYPRKGPRWGKIPYLGKPTPDQSKSGE